MSRLVNGGVSSRVESVGSLLDVLVLYGTTEKYERCVRAKTQNK